MTLSRSDQTPLCGLLFVSKVQPKGKYINRGMRWLLRDISRCSVAGRKEMGGVKHIEEFGSGIFVNKMI